MLKIGEFSKLSRVSVRMLRHYDEIGLLKPAETDRFTDYRYYREDQLPVVCRITALRDMGFSLADIVKMLDVYDDRARLEQFFASRRRELEALSRDTARKLLDIAVIRLPRISNFTDFSPFERYENVSLRYIDRVSELGSPDLILLPGTKSTIADLLWLRQSGLEAAILKEAARGTLIFGVCGGYQMLGTEVQDPDGVEAAGQTQIRGMGLLDMQTVFHGEKVQRQTSGVFSGVSGLLAGLNGLPYTGYEIHMGRSEARMPPLSGSGNVFGSYVHGIFDAPGVADTILQAVCRQRGIDASALGAFSLQAYTERQYDTLADAVRAGLDMDYVYRVLHRQDGCGK